MYKWYKTAFMCFTKQFFFFKNKFLSSHTCKVCVYLCSNKISCAFSDQKTSCVHVHDECVVYLFMVVRCSLKRILGHIVYLVHLGTMMLLKQNKFMETIC